MSYLDHQQSLKQRAASGAAVLAIQAAVGIALVTGLTFVVIEREPEPPIADYFDVPLAPVPPEPDPAPTPSAARPAQRVMAPMPPLPLPPTPGPTVERFEPTEPVTDYVPMPPRPAPSYAPAPQPSPSFAPRRAAPIGNPGSWISTDDYPAGPLRNGIEGTAGYRLVIGSDGRVTACELTRSSGNAQLDAAACRYLTNRARFAPATDGTGAAIVGTYTGTVAWQIPD